MNLSNFLTPRAIGQVAAAAVTVTVMFPMAVRGENRCDTAFSRIAIGLARKAVEDRRESICSGLKSGLVAIDRTKRFELMEANVCEDGLVVSADVSVAIKCGTSDAAMIKVNEEDVIHAAASVDFQRCTVLKANVSADTFLGSVGIASADLNSKLRAEIEKQVQAICFP